MDNQSGPETSSRWPTTGRHAAVHTGEALAIERNVDACADRLAGLIVEARRLRLILDR